MNELERHESAKRTGTARKRVPQTGGRWHLWYVLGVCLLAGTLTGAMGGDHIAWALTEGEEASAADVATPAAEGAASPVEDGATPAEEAPNPTEAAASSTEDEASPAEGVVEATEPIGGDTPMSSDATESVVDGEATASAVSPADGAQSTDSRVVLVEEPSHQQVLRRMADLIRQRPMLTVAGFGGALLAVALLIRTLAAYHDRPYALRRRRRHYVA